MKLIQGWRGSGGKNGIVVLDNINITQVNTTSVPAQTISKTEGVALQTKEKISAEEDCLQAKVDIC